MQRQRALKLEKLISRLQLAANITIHKYSHSGTKVGGMDISLIA
jgi:hypothetical protein